MTSCIVYMTASNREEAMRIGQALVGERLAACVNVLGEITSIYRWDGAIQNGTEVAFIAKSTVNRVAALTQRVIELHSYDTPCVVVLPIEGGAQAFLSWIEAEAEEKASNFT
jgi:periplasmic divalent cation tolerance protein